MEFHISDAYSKSDSKVLSLSKSSNAAEFREFTTSFMVEMNKNLVCLRQLPDLLTSLKSVLEDVSILKEDLKNIKESSQSQELEVNVIKEELKQIKLENELRDLKIQQLEEELVECKNANNALERHSRESNLRLFNVKEEANEKPEETIKKAKEIIKNTTGVDLHIEFGHRVTKYEKGSNRPIIMRVISRFQKREVLKQRSKLFQAGFPVFEDLTKMDLVAKQKHAEYMKTQYESGARVSFHSGKWWLNGKVFTDRDQD